jgi:hypothetical protein
MGKRNMRMRSWIEQSKKGHVKRLISSQQFGVKPAAIAEND